MSAEQVLGNLMAYTKLRNEYLNESLEVISSSTTSSQALATVLLVIIGMIFHGQHYHIIYSILNQIAEHFRLFNEVYLLHLE
ncbi:CIC11C00000005097 [Sungouiella intermedia]|uniref:CIC11C00000005097 n=1 Tax=Sungouiella intermedia TaxID=45354 RepID=A0A1L0CWU0_9ASCO|nr:CIC11C00000005097 [[Candida] intermedia]